jgi:hypothetical protein
MITVIQSVGAAAMRREWGVNHLDQRKQHGRSGGAQPVFAR